MNFKKFLMLLALPLAFALGSCTPEMNTDGIIPACAIVDAEGNPIDRIDIPAEGGNAAIGVVANRSWNIAITADWFAVSTSSVTNPTHELLTTAVTITAFPNTTGQARQSIVTITAEGLPTIELTVNQMSEGQTALGEVIYYDDFDKVVAEKEGDYWPYMSAEYGNPTPENQTGVSYDSKNITARANSTSNSDYSDYKGSGGNNMFFGKENHLTISGISLAALEGNAMTITFGSEKYSQTYGSLFNPSEFHVYISGDNGALWSELSYTFAGTAEGRWNVATAQFSLKEVPETLAIKFVADVASSYRMDDLTIYAGGGGAEIDLSKGSATANGGSSGGSTSGEPTNLTEATIAEFLAASVNSTTWYKLTGEIISIAKEDYGNFTIKDSTGEVYIYGMTNGWVGSNDKSFSEIGLKVGDTVTLGTLRGEYKGDPQGGGNPVPAFYISHVAGSGSGDTGGDTGSEVTPIEPGETIKATIAEFIASSESDTQWYELTGTITSIERASTGNIYIKDETGTILIYGLCATPVSKNDNSFESLGLKVNDIVTLATLRTSYNDVAQGGGTPPAYYISHVEGEEYTGPEVPDGATLVTMVSKDLGLANQTNVNGKTYNLDDNISVTFNKGNSSTPPAYYENGEAIRLYQNGATMDVTAANGKTILTIEFTFSSNQCYMSADCGSLSEENAIRTWTGESSAVKFTSTGTDKDHRVYIKEMKVIYK